ncbi:hypothetical protein D9M68_667260 [compost metagenome]
MHVVDPEIAVALVAHRLDRLERALLRLLTRKRAGHLLLVIGVEHRDSVLVHCREHRLALANELVLRLKQTECQRCCHGQKRKCHQRVETRRDPEFLHCQSPAPSALPAPPLRNLAAAGMAGRTPRACRIGKGLCKAPNNRSLNFTFLKHPFESLRRRHGGMLLAFVRRRAFPRQARSGYIFHPTGRQAA